MHQRPLPRPAAGHELLGGLLGRVPVAAHDVRPAHDQLADLAAAAPRCPSSSATHTSVPGIGDADRLGPHVDQVRAAGTRRACTPSGRTSSRCAPAGTSPRRPAIVGTRERGAGVREEAQVGQARARDAAQAEQHAEQRRDAGQAGDALLLAAAETTRPGNAKPRSSTSVAPTRDRQEAAGRARSRTTCGRHAEHAVVLPHLEVLGQRARGERHVAVRQRHALGSPGRAGRVDQCSEVDVEVRRAGAGASCGAAASTGVARRPADHRRCAHAWPRARRASATMPAVRALR